MGSSSPGGVNVNAQSVPVAPQIAVGKRFRVGGYLMGTLWLSRILVVFLLPAPQSATAQLREKLVGYEKIEIGPFKNKIGENLDDKVLAELHKTIVDKINESKMFSASLEQTLKFPRRDPDDDNSLTYPGTNNDQDSKTLLLFGEVITFNKGSQTKRWLLGGGTGRAEMRANCYLIDKKTGKQLYNFQTFGETNWGVLGGGADKTYKGMANRILEFFKGKY
jgi:hypothetical protein